jgi:triosephosphate isomerase
MQGYLFILTLPHIEKASLSHIDKINNINDYVLRHDDMYFIALSGSSDEYVEQFVEQTKASYPIYITDENPLKSMVRANPGLLLLYNGTIIAKWSHIDTPSLKKLESKYLSENPDNLIANHNTWENLTSQLLVVMLFVVMIMLAYCFRKYGSKKEADANSSTLSA